MRIAYLIANLSTTGLNNVVKDLARQFVEHGHDVTVFFMEEKGVAMAWPCTTKRLVGDFSFEDWDVVHAHGIKPMFYCWKHFHSGASVFSSHANRKRPLLVTTLHCYCFQDFTDLYGAVKGRAMGLAFIWLTRVFDRVVCLSKDMMHYYRRWIPSRKLTYAYNTRNLSASAPGEPLPFLPQRRPSEVRLGMNCVLIDRKGFDLMFEALRLLPSDYTLVVAGDGPKRAEYEQMVSTMGLTGRVTFLGMVPEAWRLIPQYDVFVLSSRSEGFPLGLLEAAAMGARVVSSDLPIVKECFHTVVPNGTDSLSDAEMVMFHLDDAHREETVRALADAIKKAAAQPLLGNHLRQAFHERFSPPQFYQRYLKIYSQLHE